MRINNEKYFCFTRFDRFNLLFYFVMLNRNEVMFLLFLTEDNNK